MTNTTPIEQLADAVMGAVARSGVIKRGPDSNIELAVEIMREEIKAFITGKTDEYKNEREYILNGGNSAHVVGIISLTCIERINAA